MQAHPDARPYKTKSVLNFNDLCLIYGYTAADGRYSRSSHDIDNDDEIQGVNLCMFLVRPVLYLAALATCYSWNFFIVIIILNNLVWTLELLIDANVIFRIISDI